jgi:hypothetical protein
MTWPCRASGHVEALARFAYRRGRHDHRGPRHAKQGPEYGYSGVGGLNALLATATTEVTASFPNWPGRTPAARKQWPKMKRPDSTTTTPANRQQLRKGRL